MRRLGFQGEVLCSAPYGTNRFKGIIDAGNAPPRFPEVLLIWEMVEDSLHQC